MASLQLLKYNPSPSPVPIFSQPNFPGKTRSLFSEFSSGKRILCLRSYGGSRYCASKRFRVCCAAQDSDKESNGKLKFFNFSSLIKNCCFLFVYCVKEGTLCLVSEKICWEICAESLNLLKVKKFQFEYEIACGFLILCLCELLINEI